MQTFVRSNFETLLSDKSLCDVSIDVGRDNEDKKTFHCVGALIAVHTKILKNKIFSIPNRHNNHHRKSANSINLNNNNFNEKRRKSSKIELIESKEEEIIELDDSEYGLNVDDEDDKMDILDHNILGGLDDDSDDDYYSNNISINDISCETFEYLRCLFYGLNPEISISNVIGIYDMSLKYGLNELERASLQYIQSISIGDYPLQFISLLLDCQNFQLYQLINELILKLPDHISQSFFTFMINNQYFDQLSNAVIEMLLFQNSSFSDMPQEYLWIAILKWAKSQSQFTEEKDKVTNNKSHSYDDDDNLNTPSTDSDDEEDKEEDEDEDSEEESKQEIIKLSSDDEDSNYNKSIDDIVNHKWNNESLYKLQNFLQYFDFSKMRHTFFREYVQTVKGLLSKDDIISVYEKHADDMIVAMKSMENVIELQRYDSNYDNNSMGTKRYKMQMFKTKEMCYHAQDINLDFQTKSLLKYLSDIQYPSVPSYNYPELKLFIEANIKSLFMDDCNHSNINKHKRGNNMETVNNNKISVEDRTENSIDHEHINRIDGDDLSDCEYNHVLSEDDEEDDDCDDYRYLYDVVFEIGKEKKCHGIRALFAIHSPVFKSMLYGNMLESHSSNNVILEDMTQDIFNCLRSCFYGFTPVITYKNVIGLFYHSDKYLITPLKQSCMEYVNTINVSQQIDAFLYILGELQAYNLCSIWKSIVNDMVKTIDINNNDHISQFLQILHKLHECELHQSWETTIKNMKIKQSVTCQQILVDPEFLKLPKIVALLFIETFRINYAGLIHQEDLWTATISWAEAKKLDHKSTNEHKQETKEDGDHDKKDGNEYEKNLIKEFVQYFDFTTMDPEFVRHEVETVNVLTQTQRINIYRSHSIQLTDLQKRVSELELAHKQHQESFQQMQNRLKGSDRTIRQLKKQHKSEMQQIRSQFQANPMSNLYQHRSMSYTTASNNNNNNHNYGNMNHNNYMSMINVSPNNSPTTTNNNNNNGNTLSMDNNSNNSDVTKGLRFEWYSREYLAVSKNSKQISTIRDDCAWLLSYLNLKCQYGVHIFSIKAHECEHGYDAIGIITVKDKSLLCGKHFPDTKLGYHYYYHPSQHSWSRGETITVMIDCESSRITFKKNNVVVQKNDIEKNKVYYPVLQTCGCAGHRYEILEYDSIRSSISKH